MESHKSLGNDSSESTSDLKDDEVGEDANLTSSEEESSTQFCSLSSEAGRHLQCFQRHQSVDEWLQGIQKVLKKQLVLIFNILGISMTIAAVKNDCEQQLIDRNESVDSKAEDKIDINLRQGSMNICEDFFESFDVQEETNNSGLELPDIFITDDIKKSKSSSFKECSNNNTDLSDNSLKSDIREILLNIISLAVENSESNNNLQENEAPVKTIAKASNQSKNDETFKEDVRSDLKNCNVHEQLNINNSTTAQESINECLFNKKNCVRVRQDDDEIQNYDLTADSKKGKELNIDISSLSLNLSEELICLNNSSESIHKKEIKSEQKILDTVLLTEKYEMKKESLNSAQKNYEAFDKTLIRSFENPSCSLETDSTSEDSESVDTRNVDKEKSSGIFDTNNVTPDRPVMQRSKSLKTCRTPPGNRSCAKLVR